MKENQPSPLNSEKLLSCTFNDYVQELIRISNFYSIQETEKRLILDTLGLDSETGELTEILKRHFQVWMLDKELLAEKFSDILGLITLYAHTLRCLIKKYTSLEETSEFGSCYIIDGLDGLKSGAESSYRLAAYLNALVQALPNPTEPDQIPDIKKAILDTFHSLVQALEELSRITI